MSNEVPHGDPGADPAPLLRAPGGRLACGADIDDLLEQAADRNATEFDAHQEDCPHCRAALTELGDLWTPILALASIPITAPPALTATVMRRLAQLLHDVWYTLEPTGAGSIRVAARTVAVLARSAAMRVPGVSIAFGRSTHEPLATLTDTATRHHRYPHTAVGILGQTAAIELTLAVTYGEPINDVAREVQRRVINELRDAIGLHHITINVTADDVVGPS
ncbi:hypothetical protein GCM10010399_25120 [Dactylosporangium fulvum]|uniref:Asp23/Gls24 family envelope stress response protein n=1 Tax=Dactylosporangium fulvum TaxID=53359 RepID=A0ABY5W8W1_9ACTN|nr:Asp23/Gls24 family envelope stress response protein [Dactylosporangium fulvum]UWP85454.1 Asp23/Gls24 family envelope stress response protein [Dactylosporangium fulvum]